MLAERVLELRLSRRWLLVASLVAHVVVIAAVIRPRYERIRWSPPAISILLPAPRPPPSPDRCVLWASSADTMVCAAYRDPPPIAPACQAPAVLREPAPTAEVVRAALLVRTAGTDVALPGRAVVAVCIAPDGRVTWTTPLRSTGDACVDQALAAIMRTWRYQPLGYAACAEVTIR